MNQIDKAADQTSQGFRDLAKSQQQARQEAGQAFMDAKDLNDLDAAQQKLNDNLEKQRQEEIKLTQAVADDADAQRAVQRARADAAKEAEKNATVLEKMGINVEAVNGKLIQTPEAMRGIAQAFEQIRDPQEQMRLRQELIAQGVDRQLIPALMKGQAAYAAFVAEGKKIEPAFTTEQIAIADKFMTALGQIGNAWSNLINQMGVAIAPTLTPFLENVRDLIVQITPGLVEFAKTISSVLGPALSGIVTTISVVVGALQVFFNAIATGINWAFGKEVTTGMQVFLVALAPIIALFAGWPTVILAVAAAIGLVIQAFEKMGGFTAIVEAAKAGWNTLIEVAGTVATTIMESWAGVEQFFVDLWTGLADIVNTAWTAISDAAQTSIDFVLGIFTGMAQSIINIWTRVKNFIIDTWNSVKDIFAKLGGGGDGNVGEGGDIVGAQGFATGGPIRGPGTSTSDSVPIWASAGEFMVKAAAVRKYGVGFLHALNNMKIEPNFDIGGLVPYQSTNPKLQFAEGGLIPARSGATLNLVIDGKSFPGLQGPERTMDELSRFATGRAMRSTGRKPAWRQ